MKRFILFSVLMAFIAFSTPTFAEPDNMEKDFLVHQNTKLDAINKRLAELKAKPATVSNQKEFVKTFFEQVEVVEDCIKSIDAEKAEKVKERKNKAFANMKHLKSQLKHYKTDIERQNAALTILDLEQEIHSCWQVINHFDDNGEFIDILQENEQIDDELAMLSQKELLTKKGSANSYITKNRNKPKFAKEVTERLILIERIDKLIE
jgi:hypothetical protein